MNANKKVMAVLTQRDDLLERLAPLIYNAMLDDEDGHGLAEEICTAAFGLRVECPQCGSVVFPGFLCWGCEDWTAPEEKP